MTKFQTYIGVDLGAENGRVIAGHWDGTRLQLTELHRFNNGSCPEQEARGALRWDIHRLWRHTKQGLASGARQFGDSLVSVGVDSWGVDYTLLDKKENLLGLPYHYRDSRTEGMMAEAFTLMPRFGIFAATGVQFLSFNTLFQLLAQLRQEPALLKEARHFLMIPDYLHWCLSGEITAEFTNATTTQFFDPTVNDWAAHLLSAFGLPQGIYPEIQAPGTKIGPVLQSVREETGLPNIDVIAPATHDTGSAVAAVPTSRTGSSSWAYISSGTWSLVGVERSDPKLTSTVEAANITNEGGVDYSIRLLKNVMGLWLLHCCRRDFAKAGLERTYVQLLEAAASAKASDSLVDPDHPSFLNPPNMVDAIQNFCRDTGQPIPESEGAIIRCVLESLAYKYAHVISLLEKHGDCRVEVIHIVGGGSQNHLLNQLTADACQRPVLSGPVEATSVGNLLVQAKGAGELSNLSEIREVVRKSFPIQEFHPVPGTESIVESTRARFERYIHNG